MRRTRSGKMTMKRRMVMMVVTIMRGRRMLFLETPEVECHDLTRTSIVRLVLVSEEMFLQNAPWYP